MHALCSCASHWAVSMFLPCHVNRQLLLLDSDPIFIFRHEGKNLEYALYYVDEIENLGSGFQTRAPHSSFARNHSKEYPARAARLFWSIRHVLCRSSSTRTCR